MLWLTARASASPSRCLRQIDQISGEYRSTRASTARLSPFPRAGHQIDNQQVIAHRVTSSGMSAGCLDQCRRATRRRETQRRRGEWPDCP